MAKNSILQRFVKSGYYQSKIPLAVQDILRVKPSTLRPSQKKVSGWRQPKYLKGVGRDGNYYRLKIPPRKRILPNLQNQYIEYIELFGALSTGETFRHLGYQPDRLLKRRYNWIFRSSSNIIM